MPCYSRKHWMQETAMRPQSDINWGANSCNAVVFLLWKVVCTEFCWYETFPRIPGRGGGGNHSSIFVIKTSCHSYATLNGIIVKASCCLNVIVVHAHETSPRGACNLCKPLICGGPCAAQFIPHKISPRGFATGSLRNLSSTCQEAGPALGQLDRFDAMVDSRINNFKKW
jgi:hypothetical protein